MQQSWMRWDKDLSWNAADLWHVRHDQYMVTAEPYANGALHDAQVALRQQRSGGPAPPGFESQDAGSPDAPVPPPGFESRPPLHDSPGYPRATNGFVKTSPAKVLLC